MTDNVTALRAEDEDLDNDWSWEVECCADITARLDRLKNGWSGGEKLSRFELYEELLELMALHEVYWCGLTPDRQRTTAREAREILRQCEALKARMKDWASEQLRKKSEAGESFCIDRWGYMHDVSAKESY